MSQEDLERIIKRINEVRSLSRGYLAGNNSDRFRNIEIPNVTGFDKNVVEKLIEIYYVDFFKSLWDLEEILLNVYGDKVMSYKRRIMEVDNVEAKFDPFLRRRELSITLDVLNDKLESNKDDQFIVKTISRFSKDIESKLLKVDKELDPTILAVVKEWDAWVNTFKGPVYGFNNTWRICIYNSIMGGELSGDVDILRKVLSHNRNIEKCNNNTRTIEVFKDAFTILHPYNMRRVL